jgi:hypothetical protein
MRSRGILLLLLLASSLVAVGCGGHSFDGPSDDTEGDAGGGDSGVPAVADDGGPGASSPADAGTSSGPGSGSFTIMSDRPIAGSSTGASYHLEASFNFAAPSCAATTLGACTVNPCYGSGSGAASPFPGVGEIRFTGAELAALPLDPTGQGSYTTLTVQGEVAWDTSGESVSVAWAHAPGDSTRGGGSIQLASPPYVALSAGSALSTAAGTISRQQDLDLSWTSDTPASSADQVLVDVTLGSTQVVCGFAAAAGAGTIPASVLQALGAGTGTYDVHSKQYASVPLPGADDSTWPVGFNVDAHARAAGGLAYGAVTIE